MVRETKLYLAGSLISDRYFARAKYHLLFPVRGKISSTEKIWVESSVCVCARVRACVWKL
jgi:hypothetical protein